MFSINDNVFFEKGQIGGKFKWNKFVAKNRVMGINNDDDHQMRKTWLSL